MPPQGQDTASQLIGLAYAEGVVTVAVTLGTVTTAQTIPAGQRYTRMTLGASLTVNLPAPTPGAKVAVDVVQDGTGSRVPTFATPAGAIKWVGAAAPTWSTVAGRVDAVDFECRDGVNWTGSAKINVA